MILQGTLERLGGGAENVGARTSSVDSIEVSGNPELRKLLGTSYLIGHLRSAVGKHVVIALAGKTIVAVKYDSKLYKDKGFLSALLSAGAGRLTLLVMVIGPILAFMLGGKSGSPNVIAWFLPPIALLLYSAHQVRTVADSIDG